MSNKQMTVARILKFQGKGLHTGASVEMIVNPAEINTGILFQRTDIEGEPIVKASADYVSDTSRGTTIEKGGIKIRTIEHIMAALSGCGVDNALIQLNNEEIPIMDGSVREYVKAIQEVGLAEQNADREYFNVTEKIHFEIPEKGVSLEIFPDDHFSVNLNIDYNSRVLGNQYARLENMGDFPVHVAPCRTFVFLHELEPLLKNNLIKGGDLDNAIIVVENELPAEEIDRLKKLFGKDDINVVSSGYLNNLELRFPNEPARHKLLDLLGDMALVGKRINGKIVANKPGHFANTELAKLARKVIKKNQNKPKFPYDPEAKYVYDINQIKNILPHRPPFLLVDKITHINESMVVGIKNVTTNEPFFVGHFPEEPVMPGVLIVEAMAQCGGILALHNIEDPENYSTYFMKIDGVKFKRKVVPGDTLLFELKLTEPIRRGIVMMDAKAYMGGQLAAEAFLMAQVVKNKI